MTQTVSFVTDTYVQSHQKQPRGRGAWVFAAYAEADHLGYSIITPSLTFAEAKRCATTVARNVYPTASNISIEVMP